MTMIADHEAMQAALAEARLAGEAGEVPIGAVVVREGAIVALGQNRVLRDHGPDGARGDCWPCARRRRRWAITGSMAARFM